ncbi:PAS domain S-box protein [Polaribacter sp.]|uniref:sensor histidine kinase n=1 Tax=Polaribacter sp. TaxID=1920175 RepID=UPI003F6B5674
MNKKKYILLLIGIILIIIFNQIIINNAISQQSSDAETINIAGKQQMYSQQIAKIASYINESKNTSSYKINIETLDSIVACFIKANTYLKEKNKLQYHTTGIDSLFKKNTFFFNKLVKSSNHLVKEPNNDSIYKSFIEEIKNNERPFLNSMDFIVNEYQLISQKRTAFLKKLQYVFLGFSILLFICGVFLMFLPVYKNNKVLNSLNIKLEKFKKEVEQKEKERKKIEEVLERTNTIARIGTWFVDLVNNENTWSKVTKEIHEVDGNFIPNVESGLKFYAEGYSRDKITELFKESVINKTSFDEELQLVTAKGRHIWVRVIGEPEIKNNECVAVYGTFQDINTVKVAQIELNTAHEELKAILNSGDISLIRTDLDGKITYFNEGAENLLGYKSEEVVDKETPIIFHDKEELLKRGRELTNKSKKEVTGFEILSKLATENREDFKEWTYIRKDGTSLHIQLSTNAIKDDTGKITAFILVGTNISRITEQNKKLANFAQIASHNFRAPVSNLISLLELYEISETPEEKKLAFEKFKIVIDLIDETLNSLIAAIQINKKSEAEIEMSNISLSKVTKKIEKKLSKQITKLNAVITTDFSAVETIVYHKPYLKSIITNLVSNALKYSFPDRKPIIEIKSAINEGRTQLIVKDNGLGINLKKHGHKLYGLNNVFHRKKDAKGVGLYIIKNQITSLKGAISCTSEVNKGTTFTITF